MNSLIDAAVGRSRTVLLLLALILTAGAVAYRDIPKESDPDVAIPIIYISIGHEGISPEDAERLLVRPLEQELRGLEGMKELRATASAGHASVLIEFDAGFDSEQALTEVREKVDAVKPKLPADSDEPVVEEVNVALFPALVVSLYGDVPERTLVQRARDLRDRIESLPGVLEVDIAGDREDLVEVLIDPEQLEAYDQSLDTAVALVQRNNQLIAAGSLDSGRGRFPVEVPGVFESLGDVQQLPLVADGDEVVTFGDVATIRRTFKDPAGFARVNGQPAVSLEVVKRIGSNIIETLDQVKALVEEARQQWPEGIEVGFAQDKSEDIRTMLGDLTNNVLTAIALVMIVIVAALGVRSAGLVGVAIPGSFLAGILVLALGGLTINIVVLFSLIMAVGMLVDGAIVVVELADRKMAEGHARGSAYRIAARRMAWPIIASTATTLAAFMPLLFWPGVVGEFMKYLPITLIATLSASLVMALVFVPTIGSLVGARPADGGQRTAALAAAEHGDLAEIRGWTGRYLRLLGVALDHPWAVLLGAALILAGVYGVYGRLGHGVEFFPDVEPEQISLNVRARGDMSVIERDTLVREVEARGAGIPDLATIYARSGTEFRSGELPEDTIGVIQLELKDWQERRPAGEILADIRERTADLGGVIVEVRRQQEGPGQGKPVQIEFSAVRAGLLERAVVHTLEGMEILGGFVDVTDSRPLPGIKWELVVDRAEAARFGADVALVGSAVQLVTNGIKVAEYRPDDADEEVDVRVRFPSSSRSLGQLRNLRMPGDHGPVPLGNFVDFRPVPHTGTIERVDGRRVLTIAADVAEGLLVDDKVRELRAWLADHPVADGVVVRFKGEDEEQRQASAFLAKAFGMALFIMTIILVTQFNSFYQALLILSAVIFSTVGVLIGLLVTAQPFGIVMCGIGVIALAGIVVNNNIVLIDTYNLLRREFGSREAILRTGAQRLRPVLLTTITTVLGLLPMVLGVNLDFVQREISVGSPSTQWWTQLSTAIAGGLTFATVLTLVLTPCLLEIGGRLGRRRARRAQPATA